MLTGDLDVQDLDSSRFRGFVGLDITSPNLD